MKKYKVILVLLIASISLSSCSEDKMDDINKNVNNPTDVPTRFAITDAMTKTAFSNTGSDLSFYTGIYVELNAGAAPGQMYNAETRNGEPISQTTYNNSWNSQYQTMYNLKLIIDKCTTGNEKGNYTTLGIAQVLYAYNLALLTDMYGDVPFSEAFQPGVVYQPKLDRQEDLYKIVFATLEDAIVNLEKTSTYAVLGSQDIIYPGGTSSDPNNSKWIKAANGLLARYTLRLSFKNPDYTKVLNYVSKSFTSKSDEFKMKNAGIPNPYYQLKIDRGYLFASKSLSDKLNNRANDPRAEGYFQKIRKSTGAPLTYEFFVNGESPQSQNYSYSALINKSNPIFMLSYHELLFIKAEAEARNSAAVTSTASLTAAVNAAFNKDETINFSSSNGASYIAGLNITTNADLLKEIAVQKYLSFYENECVEAYNDYRRLLAMYGSAAAHPIQLSNPLNESKFPLRLTYGNSDVSTNKNVKDAFGDGTYVYSENVWWAGGTR